MNSAWILMGYRHLLVRRDDATDWIALNRPEHVKTLTLPMVDELHDYFSRARVDPRLRLIVISGSGANFCAGLDLKESGQFLAAGPSSCLAYMKRSGEVVLEMRRCAQPIVAALRGVASGGGFALAVAADLRVASETVRLNSAFIRLGLSGAELGVSYLLPRIVGAAVANDLVLSNRVLHAKEAVEVRLVPRVAPEGQLDELVATTVASLLETSALGLRLTKEAMNFGMNAPSLEAAMEFEHRNQTLCLQSGVVQEGVNAFRQKRKPTFPEEQTAWNGGDLN